MVHNWFNLVLGGFTTGLSIYGLTKALKHCSRPMPWNKRTPTLYELGKAWQDQAAAYTYKDALDPREGFPLISDEEAADRLDPWDTGEADEWKETDNEDV